MALEVSSNLRDSMIQRFWDSLRELGKRRLRGDLLALSTHLKGGGNKVGAGLFSQGTSDGTRTGLRLHQRRFRLDIGRNSFTEGVVKAWPRLPRVVVVGSPSLQGFKTRVDVALGDLVEQPWWGWVDDGLDDLGGR